MVDDILLEKRKIYGYGCRIGCVVVLLMLPLDVVMYPDHKWFLLMVRVFIVMYLIMAEQLFYRVKDEHLTALTVISCVLASLSVTLCCYLTGQGFASPYYVGHFKIMVILTAFYELRPRYYALIICLIMFQHFAILSFIPWELKCLLKNIFFLGSFCIAAYMMHTLLYKLTGEIGLLRGILPICANCKKVRNDDGYWEQVDVYVKNRSKLNFTHGVCPDCTRQLYPFVSTEKQDT